MNTQCKLNYHKPCPNQLKPNQNLKFHTQNPLFPPNQNPNPTTIQHFLHDPHPKITITRRPTIQNGSKPRRQTLIPILFTKYQLDPKREIDTNFQIPWLILSLLISLLYLPELLHRPYVPRIPERISTPAAEAGPPELRRPHRHRSLHPKPNQTAPIESHQSNHCIEDRSSGFTKIIASKPPSNTHKNSQKCLGF